jgi:hypothetical protein
VKAVVAGEPGRTLARDGPASVSSRVALALASNVDPGVQVGAG